MRNLTRIIIHKTDYSSIEYIPEIPCLRIVRTGFALSHEIREECNIILNFLKQKHASDKMSLLFDLQKAEPMLQEDLEWVANKWKPQVVELGIQYIAIVLPESEWSQLNVEIVGEVMQRTQWRTIDRYFSDNELAFEWLEEVLSR